LDHDRLDLSVEAVAIESPWDKLFTKVELDTAKARLEEFGYFKRLGVPTVSSSQLSPDELPVTGAYPEGATKQLVVNAYERDARARERCINHFGPICYVCEFDFEKAYGALGKGFIQVHHLAPFGLREGPRLTDPIIDLRPVCANCHCMLHRRNPPVAIEELRQIIKTKP